MRVFDIQRFCVQDGPGIRTGVFMKGCPVKCAWCHNPESINFENELLYYSEKCVLCGRCAAVCENGVHSLSQNGLNLDRKRCNMCKRCVGVCPSDALVVSGYDIAADDLLKKILRDKVFYDNTGGGVTFTGGEPLMQADELMEAMRRCKQEGLNVAVETSSMAKWESFEKILPFADLFICDIKAADSGLHSRWTACGNEFILGNITRLFERDAPKLWIRIPLIPGFNDTDEELSAMAKLIKKGAHRIERVEIMPYHDIGNSKYTALGREYALFGLEAVDKKVAGLYREKLRGHGIDVAE